MMLSFSPDDYEYWIADVWQLAVPAPVQDVFQPWHVVALHPSSPQNHQDWIGLFVEFDVLSDSGLLMENLYSGFRLAEKQTIFSR